MALRLSSKSKTLFNLLKQSTKLNMSSLSTVGILIVKNRETRSPQPLQQTMNLLTNQKRFYAADPKQADVQEKVLNIFRNFDRIKENPAKPQVTLESHVIKDLGLDSLDHVEIIVQLEDTFGFEIPDSDYEKLYSPKEIVNYVLNRSVAV